MATDKIPDWYDHLQAHHKTYMNALEGLGKTIREDGPLDAKTAQLVQISAAAANRTRGAVHSHVRQALTCGATDQEIQHVLKLITSTIGFPAVAAALSWTDDVFKERKEH